MKFILEISCLNKFAILLYMYVKLQRKFSYILLLMENEKTINFKVKVILTRYS